MLSEVVPDGLAMLPTALRTRLQVTQQCRAEDIDAVRERYRGHDIPAELGTYFEDMAARLADAHLFIGRAGASTIAELTAVGRPAILVPLPIATDDHQAANARAMVAAGGARAIRQDRFTTVELAKQIQALSLIHIYAGRRWCRLRRRRSLMATIPTPDSSAPASAPYVPGGRGGARQRRTRVSDWVVSVYYTHLRYPANWKSTNSLQVG